jgi:IS605 OrfB family transposase
MEIMRIIALRRLREFWGRHPDAEASLRSWYQVAKQAHWQRFTDVRAFYSSADQVGKFTVFNIAGNKYRLIAVIHRNPFKGLSASAGRGMKDCSARSNILQLHWQSYASLLYNAFMAMLTYNYRIKDSVSRKHLLKMASAINYVWNYCNEVSIKAFRRDGTFLSAYDLHKLTAGTSKDLRLSADTIQQVCTEYVTRRRQFKKIRLKWRSRKRSLGWIPFKAAYIRVDGATVTYCGQRFRLWLSRPIVGTIKTGSFTQDSRGRWYVSFQCEVPDLYGPPAPAEVGIDLGLTDQIACTHLSAPLSRANITRHYAAPLALAQRARKKKRVKAIHARIANVRKDWTHKVTTAIARRARLIAVGNVSSPKLAQTRFARSTYDAAWGITRTLLQYKAMRLGAQYVEVNESWSSVTCSGCHQRTGPRGLRTLGVRVWCCTSCGVEHHRDINAAHNILRLGRETLSGIRLL